MLNFRQFKLLTFLTAAIVIQACEKLDINNFEKSDQSLKIKAEIQAQLAGPITLNWNNQDSFGLFVKANNTTGFTQLIETNRQFNYNSSLNDFQLIGEPIYYPQSKSIDLVAYAPYKANITTTYPIDISNQSDLRALDLLFSNSTQDISKQETPVSLIFNHQLSKITFSLRNGDNTSSGVENMLIALVGFHNQAEFNLTTGSLSTPILSPTPISIGLSREAIVIPNTDLAGKKFTFSIDGEHYEYTLPTSDSFEKGTVYNYLITLNNKKITVSLSNITPWTANSSGIDDTGMISNSPVEYAYIPSGVFQMGAPDTSNTAQSYDKPLHWVRISKGFYMSKHEITTSQYADFLNANGVAYNDIAKIYHNIDNESTYLFYSKRESTPYFENNKWVVMPAIKNYPMQGVTWHGALAYAKWKGATLPTEAQWEYAYRATTKSKFFTGNLANVMMAYGYYHNNTEGYVKPVGEKLPNPWGLYDIAGNVLEWCLDGPKDNEIVSYPVADSELAPIVDPIGNISNSGYAYYRGGNYSASVQLASAYSRNSIQKEYSAWQIGFRIVINP